MPSSVAASHRRFSAVWIGVIAHALLVVVLVTVLLLTEAQTSGDAQMAVGFASIPLMAVGFPWSVAALATGWVGYGLDLLLMAAAAVNLGIHALVIRRLHQHVAEGA